MILVIFYRIFIYRTMFKNYFVNGTLVLSPLFWYSFSIHIPENIDLLLFNQKKNVLKLWSLCNRQSLGVVISLLDKYIALRNRINNFKMYNWLFYSKDELFMAPSWLFSQSLAAETVSDYKSNKPGISDLVFNLIKISWSDYAIQLTAFCMVK